MSLLTESERTKLQARRAGILHHRPGKLTDESKLALLREYIEGATMAILARRYGVTPQTVAYHIDRAMRSAP